MRLVAERPEQEAGDHRPPVDEQCRRAEQGGRQERVLSEAERPEYGRKSEQRDQTAPAGLAQDAARDQQIKSEGGSLERHKRRDVGQAREDCAKQ